MLFFDDKEDKEQLFFEIEETVLKKKQNRHWPKMLAVVLCMFLGILVTVGAVIYKTGTNGISDATYIQKRVQTSISRTYDAAPVLSLDTGMYGDLEVLPHQVPKQGTLRNIKITYTEAERHLLASIIFCEAGGESFEGKLAVGYTILNRVKSWKYADNITEVVYQRGQFAPVSSGFLRSVLNNGRATESCYRAADMVLTGTGENPIGECIYFRTYRGTGLIDRLRAHGITHYVIGNHVFYYQFMR